MFGGRLPKETGDLQRVPTGAKRPGTIVDIDDDYKRRLRDEYDV